MLEKLNLILGLFYHRSLIHSKHKSKTTHVSIAELMIWKLGRKSKPKEKQKEKEKKKKQKVKGKEENRKKEKKEENERSRKKNYNKKKQIKT